MNSSARLSWWRHRTAYIPRPDATMHLMMAARAVQFLGPDGTQWSVHEISDATRPEIRKSLVFVSTEGFRRVHEFPEDWRTLGPKQLYELSWKR